MKTPLKRFLCLLCIVPILISCTPRAQVVSQVNADVSAEIVTAPSALLMEATSGQVLYELNADEPLPIASVTKTMTMLLIMEALDFGKIKLSDKVQTSEYAASMGGSQIFLEPGEEMTVEEMLKAIAVASGNDAAVAMAEFIAGGEPAFVEMMNKRAAELGCKNTHFINCNGLDETAEHHSSARDVALISRELLKHPKILDYTTIWMDTLRNGEFGLSNTNKLIRFYKGANGLKTGSTSVAKYCLSASAKRDGMQLIAVVLAAPSSAERFASASKLLDYGFANYSVVNAADKIGSLDKLPVIGGKVDFVTPVADSNASFIVKKGNQDKIDVDISINEPLRAPLSKNQKIGTATMSIGGEKVAVCDILSAEEVSRMGVPTMFWQMLRLWMCIPSAKL
ncbi:MAG: D-alanyl-D-alanine carboxypeptidase [Clostridia bacterium]|nr:D-alanyl-D-alanine carboxypeptidase [Clostridia bacterium]